MCDILSSDQTAADYTIKCQLQRKQEIFIATDQLTNSNRSRIKITSRIDHYRHMHSHAPNCNPIGCYAIIMYLCSQDGFSRNRLLKRQT